MTFGEQHPWMYHAGNNTYARLPYGVGWEDLGWSPYDGEPSEDVLIAMEASYSEAFDPAAHTVTEIQEYLASVDEVERERVIAAERGGQNRKSIVGE